MKLSDIKDRMIGQDNLATAEFLLQRLAAAERERDEARAELEAYRGLDWETIENICVTLIGVCPQLETVVNDQLAAIRRIRGGDR